MTASVDTPAIAFAAVACTCGQRATVRCDDLGELGRAHAAFERAGWLWSDLSGHSCSEACRERRDAEERWRRAGSAWEVPGPRRKPAEAGAPPARPQLARPAPPGPIDQPDLFAGRPADRRTHARKDQGP